MLSIEVNDVILTLHLSFDLLPNRFNLYLID